MKITNQKRLLAVLVAAALSAACTNKDTTRDEPQVRVSPVAVPVVEVRTSMWPQVYEATGTVRARTSAAIASRMMGHVREVRVNLGERVSAGQLLAVLDAEPLDVANASAEAAVAEARSVQPEIEKAVDAAKAQLELAQTTYGRMRELFGKKSISNQEFDEASARLKVAEANHAMAVAKREQLAAKLAQAEQGVAAARINRGYSRIVAPFAGVVVEKPVEPGMLATPGAPLMTIEQTGGWRLEASVEESRLPGIRRGQSVEVQLEALGRSLNGRVAEIVPSVDAASRTGTVKIDLPADSGLRGGLFGRARFSEGQRELLAIPYDAVRQRGQLQTVFVAAGNTAQARMVTLGERNGGEVEVLSGLAAGEVLIHPVPSELLDGAPITRTATPAGGGRQ